MVHPLRSPPGNTENSKYVISVRYLMHNVLNSCSLELFEEDKNLVPYINKIQNIQGISIWKTNKMKQLKEHNEPNIICREMIKIREASEQDWLQELESNSQAVTRCSRKYLMLFPSNAAMYHGRDCSQPICFMFLH